jgi:uncharacterized repeat protein (TIGR03803 family)
LLFAWFFLALLCPVLRPPAAFSQDSNFIYSATLTVSNAYLISVIAADVNKDGYPDLVCADQNNFQNHSTNVLTVFTNNSKGSFLYSTNVKVDVSPVWVQAADIYGNGRLDLISGGNVNNTLTICTNKGGGVFASNAVYAVAGNPYNFAVADVNGDGKPDLVVATYNNTSQSLNSISVLTNNGSGKFATSWTFGDYFYARAVAVADFNGDGKPDLAVAYYTYGLIGIYTNIGNGRFAKAGTVSVNGASSFVAAADFNGDGAPDLAVADSLDGNGVTVLTNNGDGTFTQQGNYAVGGNPITLTVTDINGDGLMDIVAANYQSANTAGILTNDGGGNFVLEAALPAGNAPVCVAVDDFNKDGTPDLAIADNTNTVVVYLGVAPTALYSFSGLDGDTPESGVAQTTNGVFYGTTTYGGAYSQGSVYQISADGTFTNLYSLTAGADGFQPWPGVTLGTNGFLYGTAGGGNYYSQYSIYAGVIYRMTTNGAYTGLHTLAFPAEGALPGPLVKSSGGSAFFGMTQFGGTNLNAEDQYGNIIGCGTIFRINTNGTFSTVYSFGGTNGGGPSGPLLLGADNHLYGMTEGGQGFTGLNPGSIFSGNGTIFKVATNGTGFTTLHFFDNTNGANPYHNGLAQAANGNLFGTTIIGGASNNGTIFEVSTNGDFTSLYSFTGGNDGGQPMSTMVYASDGNLYGTTRVGGTNNLGTIFEVGTNGLFQTLYSFSGDDGAYPEGPVTQGRNGRLYGTTAGDGVDNHGTVFAYAPSLKPEIVNQPAPTTVSSGDTATFEVDMLGALPLHYRWLSNSISLASQTNSVLTLAAVTTNSEASYSVIITNLYGSVTSSVAALLVQAFLPVITNQPDDEIVSNTGTATFTVGAMGSPVLRYQWQSNSVPLAKATNATLILASVKTNTAAGYSVVVTNLYGAVTSRVAMLTIGAIAPSIVAQPTNVTVGIGDAAAINVAVTGTIPLRYHWQKNGADLVDGGNVSGSTNATLAFSSTTTNDIGNYTLVVTNYYGSITSVITLMLVPIEIDVPPQDVTVTNGQPATFSVIASGAGPFGYQWQKNGANISAGGNISGSASGVLTFSSTSLADEGFYDVIVTNAYTNVVSSLVALTVVFSGTNAVDFTSDSTVVLTTTKTISSEVTIDGNGHNVVISGGGAIQPFVVVPPGHLTLRNLAVADGNAGQFGGAICNNGGSVTVTNCLFNGNVAGGGHGTTNGYGGAIYNNGGTLQIDGCTFLSNQVTGYYSGRYVLYNSAYDFYYYVYDGGSGSGGAVYNGNYGTVIMNCSLLSSNKALGVAGGNGYNSSGAGGQAANGGNGYGGGIYNEAGCQLYVTNCTFYNNQAVGGAGGKGGPGQNEGYYCCYYNNGFCQQYCFEDGYPGGNGGNGGNGYGGNLYAVLGALMVNTTVANGSATAGAAGPAGANGSGYFPCYNGCPGYAGSGGTGLGGNVATGSGAFTGVAFENCIMANPIAGGNLYGYWYDYGNNLSSDGTFADPGWSSMGNANPNFGPLSNNGGLTMTLALLPASPAIRAGNTNGAPLTDQRGFPRKALLIDIGAFETQVATSSVPPVVTAYVASGTNQFHLAFSNTPGDTFSIWSSTNLLLPFTAWTWLGYAREVAPGQFQFNDSRVTNNPQAYYRISSP